MAVKKSLVNIAYKLSLGWAIMWALLTISIITSGLRNGPPIPLYEAFFFVFIGSTIATVPYAIIKYMKKNMEKNLHGQIQ